MREWYTRQSMVGVALAMCLVLAAPLASAERFQSTSYTIDSSVGNSFGGSTNATSYKLESSGGEAIVGDGSSGSYKLGHGYIAGLQKSLELNIQPSNVTAYYGFNENFGVKAYDNSVYNATATLASNPSWVVGKIGKALTFNGSSQSASIDSTTQNNIETVTVSAWIRTSQVPSAATPIVQKWAGSGGYPYALLLNADGSAGFAASDGTNIPLVSSSGVVNDGLWHHIVGVRTKASTLKIYVDGTLSNTVIDTTAAATSNTAAIGVAKRDGGTAYFNGTIDEVKIFNEALPDQAVAHEYSAQNTGYSSSQTFADIGTTSQTVNTIAVVQTDAPSYTMALSQNQNLTSGANSISAIAGTIASPAAWTEGTTNGLGFTLTSGIGIDGKWGTSPNYNYAAIPGLATAFYTRSGYSGGVKDQLTIQYRVDAPTSQVAGSYNNTVTYTATIQP